MRTKYAPFPENVFVPFCATVSDHDTATIVRLSGELDLATEEQVAAVVDRLPRAATSVVRVDLTEVTFCDARGLAAIVTVRRRLRQSGRHLVLTGVPDAIRRLLHLTRLEAHLDLK